MVGLKAAAYHMGKKGMYSKSAKLFIAEGLKRYEDGLTPKEKREFAEIRNNCTTEVSLHTAHLRAYKKKVKLPPEPTETPEPQPEPESQPETGEVPS